MHKHRLTKLWTCLTSLGRKFSRSPNDDYTNVHSIERSAIFFLFFSICNENLSVQFFSSSDWYATVSKSLKIVTVTQAKKSLAVRPGKPSISHLRVCMPLYQKKYHIFLSGTFQGHVSQFFCACWIPKSSCEGFFQRTAAKFNFSLHLHNISYILCIAYIIYSNFIYTTYIIYILYMSIVSLHHLHRLHHLLHHLNISKSISSTTSHTLSTSTSSTSHSIIYLYLPTSFTRPRGAELLHISYNSHNVIYKIVRVGRAAVRWNANLHGIQTLISSAYLLHFPICMASGQANNRQPFLISAQLGRSNCGERTTTDLFLGILHRDWSILCVPLLWWGIYTWIVVFAQPRHSTEIKSVTHVRFDTMTWALRGIPF